MVLYSTVLDIGQMGGGDMEETGHGKGVGCDLTVARVCESILK